MLVFLNNITQYCTVNRKKGLGENNQKSVLTSKKATVLTRGRMGDSSRAQFFVIESDICIF